MNFLPSSLVASSLVVEHNAVKNILFRTATIILEFVILRVFAFIAFQCRDYTSFLVFAEDIIQKALFVFSKGFRRQALLVATFAIFVAAVGFYDTLLWGLDSPGYVPRTRVVDGGTLASQMVNSPAYLNYITANETDPSTQNNLNTTFNANLYAQGLNFTLPGIFNKGQVKVVPPLHDLDHRQTARIWLDRAGFAVGLDSSVMWARNMLLQNTTTSIDCQPDNPPGETVTQTWMCNVPDADGPALFSKIYGNVQIWWDEARDFVSLTPFRDDNPWNSIGANGGTAMMKQVFTVTKEYRRHTFLSTVFKASMFSALPDKLDDTEITDFMRRTWSLANGTVTPALTTLTNNVLYAKGNETGTSFGTFTQRNTSLLSISTEFVNLYEYSPFGSGLRFSTTNITLIRSETLDTTPPPVEQCPGEGYIIATGSVVRLNMCRLSLEYVQTAKFLGMIDTSAVTIITGFLGDGTSNLSSVALSDSGMSWLTQNEGQIDNLLISRALLLGGNRTDVKVHVDYTVPAISIVQLVLCLIPIALALLAHLLTRKQEMSYFKSSFLAAVLATTHVGRAPSSCEELGYIHSMPEISLQRDGRHVTLGTPGGGTIANTVLEPRALVYEPLVLTKDEQLEMLVQHHDQC